MKTKTWFYIICSFFGSVFLYMSRIPLEKAKSNIGSYLSPLGFNSEWIQSGSIDIIFTVLGVLLLITAIIIILPKVIPNRLLRGKLMYIPGVILIVLGVTWVIVVYINSAPLSQKKTEGKQNQETALKESPIDKKPEIINQLNQFVRNGNDLLLQISSVHSSQFPPKFPSKFSQMKNMKPYPMEVKIAGWNKGVYDYLVDNVPARAEYYHKLSIHDFPSVKSKNVIMAPQEQYRLSMNMLVDGHIERILEIIKYVDSSGN